MITELVFYKQDANDYDERFPLNIKLRTDSVTSVAADVVSSYTQSGGGLKLTLETPIVGTSIFVQFEGTNEGLIGGYTAANGGIIELLAMDINGYVFTIDSSCTNDDTSVDSYGDTCSDYYD